MDYSAYIFQSTRPVWGATHGVEHGVLVLRHFNPRAPCGARPTWSQTPAGCRNFNPRAPCGARRFGCLYVRPGSNFNPRAPCGARPSRRWRRNGRLRFQSTRPVWGATLIVAHVEDATTFQSTRPVWGATKPPERRGRHGEKISIHAPRVGRDLPLPSVTFSYPEFQSTRPVWGATNGRLRKKRKRT